MKKNLFPLLLLAVSTTFAKDAGKAETPEQICKNSIASIRKKMPRITVCPLTTTPAPK